MTDEESRIAGKEPVRARDPVPSSIVVTLPAAWASALMNGDFSGIDQDDPAEGDRIRQWMEVNDLHAFSCSEESFTTRLNGILTECLDFHFRPGAPEKSSGSAMISPLSDEGGSSPDSAPETSPATDPVASATPDPQP